MNTTSRINANLMSKPTDQIPGTRAGDRERRRRANQTRRQEWENHLGMMKKEG